MFRIAPPCGGTPQSLRMLESEAFPSKRDMAHRARGTPQSPVHYLKDLANLRTEIVHVVKAEAKMRQ